MYSVTRINRFNILKLKMVSDILYKCGKDMAKKYECQDIVCEVYDKSEHAKKFYEHRGFTICGTTETLKYKQLKLRKEL